MLEDISRGGDLTIGYLALPRTRGRLARYFNQFVERIQTMTRDIYDMTMAPSESSGTLTQVSNALAANSEEMNAKTDNVMAALEEITVSIDDTVSSDDARNNRA